MAALRTFTVFRRVPGVLDFVPTARFIAVDLADATRQAERVVAAPVVCHAHSGECEPVDFAQHPVPARRSRRHA